MDEWETRLREAATGRGSSSPGVGVLSADLRAALTSLDNERMRTEHTIIARDAARDRIDALVAVTLVDVAVAIDRAQRCLDSVPMPCVETNLAIDALETAAQLVGDALGAKEPPR